jgi:hypothetical protein
VQPVPGVEIFTRRCVRRANTSGKVSTATKANQGLKDKIKPGKRIQSKRGIAPAWRCGRDAESESRTK